MMEEAILPLRVYFPEPCLSPEIHKEVRDLYESTGRGVIENKVLHLLIDLLERIVEYSVEGRVLLRNTKISHCFQSVLVRCNQCLEFLVTPDYFMLNKNGQTSSYQHTHQELFLQSFLSYTL